MPAMTSDQVLTLLRNNGVKDTDLGSWLATAKAESSLNPAVVNSIGATGLFQINQPVHVKDHPDWSIAFLQNPQNNVAAARVVSNGWTNHRPWVSSTLGQATALPASRLEATRFLQNPVQRGVESGAVAASGAIDAATGPLRAAGSLAHALTQPGTWLRVGYGLVGVLLIAVAVQQLTGSVPVVNKAVKVATKGLA